MTVPPDEVRRLFGDLEDHMVVEILSTGASLAVLEDVAVHLAQSTDRMGEADRPLDALGRRIYELLRREEDLPDEPA